MITSYDTSYSNTLIDSLDASVAVISEELVHERHAVLDEGVDEHPRLLQQRAQDDASRQFLRHHDEGTEDGDDGVPAIEQVRVVFVDPEGQLLGHQVEVMEDDAVVHRKIRPDRKKYQPEPRARKDSQFLTLLDKNMTKICSLLFSNKKAVQWKNE